MASTAELSKVLRSEVVKRERHYKNVDKRNKWFDSIKGKKETVALRKTFEKKKSEAQKAKVEMDQIDAKINSVFPELLAKRINEYLDKNGFDFEKSRTYSGSVLKIKNLDPNVKYTFVGAFKDAKKEQNDINKVKLGELIKPLDNLTASRFSLVFKDSSGKKQDFKLSSFRKRK